MSFENRTKLKYNTCRECKIAKRGIIPMAGTIKDFLIRLSSDYRLDIYQAPSYSRKGRHAKWACRAAGGMSVPPVIDANELKKYLAVLEQAVRFSNLVDWRPRCSEWVFKNLSNHTPKAIITLMWQHHNKVRQKVEDQADIKDRDPEHPLRYQIVIPIEGLEVFIKTVFDAAPIDDDCKIIVVSIHESSK